MEQKASLGRIVHYKISEQDALEINRRRTNSYKIQEQVEAGKWSIGSQAHIGNEVSAGQTFPMIIVAVWSDTLVNGQVFLDGNDSFWALSRSKGNGVGEWRFPLIN